MVVVDKAYGRPFGGLTCRVLAMSEGDSCESGWLVAVRSDKFNKNVTLDSHWLTFISRPEMPAGMEDWDDDIPFDSSAYYCTHNGERIPFKDSKEIYFE